MSLFSRQTDLQQHTICYASRLETILILALPSSSNVKRKIRSENSPFSFSISLLRYNLDRLEGARNDRFSRHQEPMFRSLTRKMNIEKDSDRLFVLVCFCRFFGNSYMQIRFESETHTHQLVMLAKEILAFALCSSMLIVSR